MIALIPARAGSKRIPGKNTKLLAGHPLIAYTIAAAKQSGVFADITVCSDDRAALTIGDDMGVYTWERPPSPDDEPDIAWVREYMRHSSQDSFAILRPTSPFRTAGTIRRADCLFSSEIDSLRAVEPWSGPHPGKMWTFDHVMMLMSPVVREWTAHAPYHSSPTQELVPVVRQNACLEMAWTRNIRTNPPTIAGEYVAPFFTEGHEGHDLNTLDDWTEAERLIECGAARLPDLR